MIITSNQIIGENLIAVAKKIADFSPPLYITSSSKPELVSSSILVRWRDSYFLVTTSHTLRLYAQAPMGLIFNNTFLTLGSENAATYSVKIDQDKIDIGAYKLDANSVTLLRQSYSFYDLESFNFDHVDVADDAYLIVGYPITRAKVRVDKNKIRLSPFVFRTSLNEKFKSHDKIGTKKEINFILNYRKQRIKDLLSTNIVQGPKPNGLSGCGVWIISNPLTHDVNEIRYYPTGIIIEYFKEYSILVGTRMRIVTEFLRHAFDSRISASMLAKSRITKFH